MPPLQGIRYCEIKSKRCVLISARVHSIHCIFWHLIICDFLTHNIIPLIKKSKCWEGNKVSRKIPKLKHFRDNEDLYPKLKMVESVLGNWDDWFLSPLFFGSLVMHIASRQTQLITGLPQAILSSVLQRKWEGGCKVKPLNNVTFWWKAHHDLEVGGREGEHSIC